MRVLERCGPTHGWPALGWLRASSCSHWKQVVRWVKQERVSRCTSMLRVSRLSEGRGAEQAMRPAPSAPPTHLPHSLPSPPTSCLSYFLPTHFLSHPLTCPCPIPSMQGHYWSIAAVLVERQGRCRRSGSAPGPSPGRRRRRKERIKSETRKGSHQGK